MTNYNARALPHTLTLNTTNLDKTLNRLVNAAIGYEPLFRLFEDTGTVMDPHGYPPYNIEKLGEDQYRISIAVAGFSESDIEITEHDRKLTVEGKQQADATERTFIHKGIASRNFTRTFQLAEYIEVSGARMVNGILEIDLFRNVPEERKPKKIGITAAGQVIEADITAKEPKKLK
jgi:molecular chaperone IbpA